MATIDGGLIGADGRPVYYTPAVLMDLAVCVAGLDGREHAIMILCKIHGYGFPNWVDDDKRSVKACKSNNPRVSKAWLVAHTAGGRSAGYRAVDSLIQRRLLVLRGNNTLIINKWIDEWLDKDGRPLFDPDTNGGRERLQMILDSLDRQTWWQQPAAYLRRLFPAKTGTRQIPFQSGVGDNAKPVPSPTPDSPDGDLSGVGDKRNEILSGVGDNNSGVGDNHRPQTPENARKTPALDLYWKEDMEVPFRDSGLVEFARSLPRGDAVCAELEPSRLKFPRISWRIALENWQHHPTPDAIANPVAFIVATAKNPKRARYLPSKQATPLTGQENAGTAGQQPGHAPPRPPVSAKPDSQSVQALAQAFTRRPSAQKIGGLAEMRADPAMRAYAAQLERWINAGCPESGKPLDAMAAAEDGLRRTCDPEWAKQAADAHAEKLRLLQERSAAREASAGGT